MKKELKGKMVTMSADGWSSSTNQPIVGICLADELYQTLETDDKHTIDVLTALLQAALDRVEAEMPETTVVGLVTDSAANMHGTRRNISRNTNDRCCVNIF